MNFFKFSVFIFITSIVICFSAAENVIGQLKLIHIKGGTFMMGSPDSEIDRIDKEVQRSITVSSFYMGKYEVTQKEYQEIMGINPSHFKGSDLPVENVSWFDVIEYCNKRSLKEGLTPAYTISENKRNRNVTWNRDANGYRLPTEAEWEYACRAGTTTPFSTGNDITANQANYNGNYPYNDLLKEKPKGVYRQKTTPAGSFAPNKWGLYDMHGNVREWCWDWYKDYNIKEQNDPAGPALGGHRIIRGGSWGYFAQLLRSAFRSCDYPDSRNEFIGFRVVRP